MSHPSMGGFKPRLCNITRTKAHASVFAGFVSKELKGDDTRDSLSGQQEVLKRDLGTQLVVSGDSACQNYEEEA